MVARGNMNLQKEHYEFWESVTISVLLIISLWGLLQISSDYKLLVFFVIAPVVFFIVFSFRETHQHFNVGHTHKRILFQLFALFLLAPVALLGLKAISTSRYLESYPFDNTISYKINIDISDSDFGGIGNEWSYNYFANGENVETNDVVTISSNQSLVLKAEFCEHDPTYNDYGSASNKVAFLANNKIPEKEIYLTQEIFVHETRGRGAGSSAHFKVNYILKRVFPSNYGIYRTVQYGGHGFLLLAIAFTVWQIIACMIVLKRISATRRIKLYVERVEKERLEQERQAQIKRKNEIAAALAKKAEEEKRLYIEQRAATLKLKLGEDYERVVKIPDDVSFAADGKPIRGRSSKNAPYGHYSVYITQNGKCYHCSAKCCRGNYRTVHLFDVLHLYKPCSNCVDYSMMRSVPEWYKKVIEIQKKS